MQSLEESWADVVIICALDVEYQQLKERLRELGPILIDPRLSFRHFVARRDAELIVLVVRLPAPNAGNVTSGIVAAALIASHDPWLLVSFGIAGTLDPGELRVLDVLYSRSVSYLDLRKETSQGTVTKLVVERTTDIRLLRFLEQLVPGTRHHKCHEVDMVATEAVFKYEEADRRKAARESVADAKAVDMESFGVYQACEVDKDCLSRTARLCVAIKGISDNADPAKAANFQEKASRNAANFLARMLEASGLDALRREVRIDRRPRPLRPVIRRPQAEVRASVDQFGAIIQSLAQEGWDESVVGAAHSACRFPRVFYHWRLTGKGLHWVEYKFLRILRELDRLGYPVECLVTDALLPMQHLRLAPSDLPEARDNTRRMVAAMIPADGKTAPTTFYSDVCRLEEALASYAQTAGYSHEMRDVLSIGAVGALPSVVETTQVNLEFNEWLPYIAWRVRREGVCIVFHWFKSTEVYRLLWNFAGLTPALVPTRGFWLGARWGKFDLPGCELYLLPPDHAAILNWLAKDPEADLLKEFWTHLIEQEELAVEHFVDARRRWAGAGISEYLPRTADETWLRAFTEGRPADTNYFKGAIVVELAHMNRSYFADQEWK